MALVIYSKLKELQIQEKEIYEFGNWLRSFANESAWENDDEYDDLVIKIKQEPTVSLFDYLGYAAGARLGKEVAQAAVRCNEKVAKKAISTRTYTGDVLLYRQQFLKEFFDGKQNF